MNDMTSNYFLGSMRIGNGSGYLSLFSVGTSNGDSSPSGMRSEYRCKRLTTRRNVSIRTKDSPIHILRPGREDTWFNMDYTYINDSRSHT